MKDQTRRFLAPVVLLGVILIIAQIVFAFFGNFLNLNRMISSTATTLLASTNHEVMANLNERFNRMIRVGNQVAGDEQFNSYDRTESTLPKPDQAAHESALGRALSTYTSLDDFSDCCMVYKDGSYLGQLDSHTEKLYAGQKLYNAFKDTGERDTQNFFTGYQDDYTRIYYAKTVNSGSLILISILCDSLNTIFYDAEENYNLTLHMSTIDHNILYSGDKDESINHILNADLAQAIESSSHTVIEMRGQVIASDTCVNGFRITSTIPESALTAENSNGRALYLIISVCFIVLSAVLLFILCRRIIKRAHEVGDGAENSDDSIDLNDININV